MLSVTAAIEAKSDLVLRFAIIGVCCAGYYVNRMSSAKAGTPLSNEPELARFVGSFQNAIERLAVHAECLCCRRLVAVKTQHDLTDEVPFH